MLKSCRDISALLHIRPLACTVSERCFLPRQGLFTWDMQMSSQLAVSQKRARQTKTKLAEMAGCGCRTNTTRTQQRTPTPRLKREHAKKTHTCSHRRTGKSAVLHRIRFLGQGKRGTKSPLRFVRDLNPGPLHPKRESHPGTNAPTFGHS